MSADSQKATMKAQHQATGAKEDPVSVDSPTQPGLGKGTGKPAKGKGKTYAGKGRGKGKFQRPSPFLRNQGRGNGHVGSRSIHGNRTSGQAAGSNKSVAPGKKQASFVQLQATGLMQQYKAAADKTVALVLSKTELSKEQKQNEEKTCMVMKKAELKGMNMNASTAVGEIWSTAFRAITEENKETKTAKLSVDLKEARDKHVAAAMLPVNLANLVCITGNTFMKLQQDNLTDDKLKVIDTELMGFPAVVSGSPESLKVSHVNLKNVLETVTSQHFDGIFTSNGSDHGPDKFYSETYQPLVFEASRIVVNKIYCKLKERAVGLQLQASKDLNKDMIAAAVAEKTTEIKLMKETQAQLLARLDALENEKKRPAEYDNDYRGHMEYRSYNDRSYDHPVHPHDGDARAVEQRYRNVSQKQDTHDLARGAPRTYDRPGRVQPSQGRVYFENGDQRRDYRYKTDDQPLPAYESYRIDDNDVASIIDQLSAAFDRPSNLQTAIHKVWLVDVDECDFEELSGLTNIFSEYGLSYTAKPSMHGNKTVSMINIIGNVNPVFDAAGGIHSLAATLSNDAGPPTPLNKDEISVNKTLSEIPTGILSKYTVAETDKGVGPAIISNSWMDFMKVKAISGKGFEIIGISKLPGFWSLDDSVDTPVPHNIMLEQTVEAFLCAIDSANDIAPTDRDRSLREIAQPMSHQRELGNFSGLAKVLKVPTALRPNVDMSDTFTEVTCKIINAALQIIAKAFRKQYNSMDDYVTA